MIVAEEELSVCEQCQLLGVARSSYYQQGGGENEDQHGPDASHG